MANVLQRLSQVMLGRDYKDLEEVEREVIESIAQSEPIAANTNEAYQDQLSFGERLADRISTFGGSWSFIIIFLSILFFWMLINTLVLTNQGFDPYPYILLNLVLSSLAAFQAPIIMMSQNRQSHKDRLDSAENYKVSLKTDLEIMHLHEKIDLLTSRLQGEISPESGKETSI